MYEVVVSTVRTGRVVSRRFPSQSRAWAVAEHAKDIAMRKRAGLRGVRVEVIRR